MNFPHPDDLYRSLMELAKHPSKRRNLDSLHTLCREEYNLGSALFTTSRIERLLVVKGILSPKTLGNAKSEDYRTLILAWASFSKEQHPSKTSKSQDWIENIPDPAVRQLVQITRAELTKLRGEVLVLRKLQKSIIVRTGTATLNDGLEELSLEVSKNILLPTERTSLSQAIDQEYLLKHGLSIGSRGEILQKNGIVLFERGFVEGVKKILGMT